MMRAYGLPEGFVAKICPSPAHGDIAWIGVRMRPSLMELMEFMCREPIKRADGFGGLFGISRLSEDFTNKGGEYVKL